MTANRPNSKSFAETSSYGRTVFGRRDFVRVDRPKRVNQKTTCYFVGRAADHLDINVISRMSSSRLIRVLKPIKHQSKSELTIRNIYTHTMLAYPALWFQSVFLDHLHFYMTIN